MRSRLPGKLRSSAELPGAVIMKNRAGFAKRRFVISRLIAQILHNRDQTPGQHEAQAHEQEQSERNIHDIHRHRILQAIIKCQGFPRL